MSNFAFRLPCVPGRMAGSNAETRRDWLQRMLALGLTLEGLARASSTHGESTKTKWSMPGLYPGRVVRVEHPGSIVNGAYQKEPVAQMISRGLRELTGAPDSRAAWQSFFEPADVVGIKLNPVSRPYVISAPEVLHEIVAGLESAA